MFRFSKNGILCREINVYLGSGFFQLVLCFVTSKEVGAKGMELVGEITRRGIDRLIAGMVILRFSQSAVALFP